MSRSQLSKPTTSLSVRSKTGTQTDSISRPGTRQGVLRSQQSDLKPAQVHELKLQTQQIKQQTKILKTQLKRTEFQISSHTNSINKTFEQSSEKPQTTTNHANTILYLKQNIEGAKHTLESLKDQVKEAENDDKTSTVEELEEELKITYCEYKRLARTLQDRKAEANHYDRELSEAAAEVHNFKPESSRASNQHINELKAAIRDLRSQNASLRDKSRAYQVKIEKIKIDQQIKEHQDQRVDLATTLKNIDQEKTDLNTAMDEICKELNAEADQFDQNVDELTKIIEEMKMKIINRLKEKDDNRSTTSTSKQQEEA